MAMGNRNALIVLTSNDRLGETGIKTGFWYNELSRPYWALIDAGFSVDIASVKGGTAPHSPDGVGPGVETPETARFLADKASVLKVKASLPVDALNPLTYSAIHLPGGYGTMWDLEQSDELAEIVGTAYGNGAVIGAICHGQAGLLRALNSNGRPVVERLRVSSCTNAEEETRGLTSILPFLLESRLRALGAKFESAPNFHSIAVHDGRLVTAQNEESVGMYTEQLLRAISSSR
ncbi:Putative intracellular protease/amidase [Burkholderia sp. GAS332]|nr:Putative intracellular protease/amidase [Burkholderia sp. GAS332]